MTIEFIGKLFPKAYLAKLLEESDNIESIATVTQWKNGLITTGWTNCQSNDLALMLLQFESNVMDKIVDLDDEQLGDDDDDSA